MGRPDPLDKEWLSTGEVVALLHHAVSVRTVSRWAKEGKLQARRFGAHYRYRREDVEHQRIGVGG